jgi:hypothetical protein
MSILFFTRLGMMYYEHVYDLSDDLSHPACQPEMSRDKLGQGLLFESVNALKNALCYCKNHYLNLTRLLTAETTPSNRQIIPL